jgi:hypothetical protein
MGRKSKQLAPHPSHLDGVQDVFARAAARIATQVPNLVLALPLAACDLQPTAPAPRTRVTCLSGHAFSKKSEGLATACGGRP